MKRLSERKKPDFVPTAEATARLNLGDDTLRKIILGLETSRNTYLDLYANAPFAYVSLDAEGRIDRVNHAMVATLGDSARRLKGRLFESFVLPADVETWRGHLRQARTRHDITTAELGLFTGRGRIVVRVSSSHLADDGDSTMTALVEAPNAEPSRDRAWLAGARALLARAMRLLAELEPAASPSLTELGAVLRNLEQWLSSESDRTDPMR